MGVNTTLTSNVIYIADEVNIPVLHHRSQILNIFIGITIIIIAICSVVGNGVIMLLVGIDRDLRGQASNILVMNLAAVDIVTALTVMTTSSIAVMADRWPFSALSCTVQLFFNFICMALTLILIMTLTLDRLISVMNPLRYHSMVTIPRMLVVLLPLYALASFFTIYPLVNGRIVFDYWEAACSLDWAATVGSTRTVFFCGFFSIFVIPGLLILFSNIYIIFVAQNLRVSHLSTSQLGLSTIPAYPKPKSLVHLPAENTNIRIGNRKENMACGERPEMGTNLLARADSEGAEDLQVFIQQPVSCHGSTPSHDAAVIGSDGALTTVSETLVSPGIATEGPINYSNEASSGSKRCNYTCGTKNNLANQASLKLSSRGRASLTSRRIFYSIFTVTVVFFVCLMPYSVVRNLKLLIGDSYWAVPGEASLFGTLLQFVNSMANPLIYGILRQDFRRAYYRLRRRISF